MNGRLVSACVILSLLTGCEGMDKEKIGAIGGGLIGAAGGGYAGSKMTKDPKTGALIGGVIGLVGGALIGKEIGKMLDERDRKRHAEATAKALETGQSQAWSSPDTGASGQITVKEPAPIQTVNTPAPATPPVAKETTTPAPTPQVVAQGPLCRTVTQTIKLQDGRTKTEELKACKGPNGWEAA